MEKKNICGTVLKNESLSTGLLGVSVCVFHPVMLPPVCIFYLTWKHLPVEQSK